MLANETQIYLLIPSSGKEKTLYPAKITGREAGTILAKFDEPLGLSPGLEIVIFFHTDAGKFVQQGAQIVASPETAQSSDFAFKTTSEPISAERRQIYRVSTALCHITATIGQEKNCQVVDVSSEGCAVVTGQELAIGSTVKITFGGQAPAVCADARVQTVKQLSPTRFRYGLYVPDKKSPARKALAAVAMEVQREQLKRISGAA
jgi:hypothetical protein